MTESVEPTSRCWWCSDADADHAVQFELYRDVQRQSAGGNATKVSWKSFQVPITRCASCRAKHGRGGRMPMLTAVIFGAVTLLVIYLSTKDWLSESRGDTKMWMAIFFLIVVIAAFAGRVVGDMFSASMMRKAGTRPYDDAAQHPAVAALIADGWTIGRPKQ
jgi:hypothetical protein